MPRELPHRATPYLDTVDVVRFVKDATVSPVRNIAPIATANGAVSIKPYKRYLLIVATTAIRFKLSVAGTGAAAGTDTLWPPNTPLVFDSEEFDTFHADGVTGTLTELGTSNNA